MLRFNNRKKLEDKGQHENRRYGRCMRIKEKAGGEGRR